MKNPLLNFEGLPRFDEIRPEHISPAIDTLLERCRTVVTGLEAPMPEIAGTISSLLWTIAPNSSPVHGASSAI